MKKSLLFGAMMAIGASALNAQLYNPIESDHVLNLTGLSGVYINNGFSITNSSLKI